MTTQHDSLGPAFPTEALARRRRSVLDRLQGGALVLPAAPHRFRSRDTEYRYRPDSELFYLTGLTEPGAVAVLRDVEEGDRFVLFVRERDEEAERWTGPRAGPERAAELFGADATHSLGELEDRLPGLLSAARRLHYRLGADPRTQVLVLEALETARRRGSRKGTGPRSVVDPGEILDELRLRKDPEELARIRRAARVTGDGFRAALAAVRPGAGEWEVEAALEGAFRRAGAGGPSFQTIVGSGANACVLHYDRNGDTMEEGDLVLVDGGAEVGLYNGDVTRTVPVSGRFTPEQRDLYDIVDEARRAAVGAVTPGAGVADVHDAALRILVEGMLDVGLLRGSTDALIEEEAHKAYFPHQTSHWLGLDVHDPGDYARDDEPRSLEAGMVLTVEPGLYVPAGTEEPGAAPFAGIGVRIEDDVLVTTEGGENLTGALPSAADEVAALVGG